MAKVEKRLLVPERRRTLPASGFSWIDRRFVRDGFLAALTGREALLYLFLVAVADQDGISFWGDRRVSALVKLDEAALADARRGLQEKDLILYRPPLYQVLSLPDSAPPPCPQAPRTPSGPQRDATPREPLSFAEILRRLREPPPAGGGDAR